MRIVAIDPGPRQSAWVILDADTAHPLEHAIQDNETLAASMRAASGVVPPAVPRMLYRDCKHLAIEMVASYGMTVGKDVFETAFWVGRFVEAWSGPYTLVYRKDVKLTLCMDSRARDSNVRQALIDRYPPTGGGRVPQIGTKKAPGPLYGISCDVWAALAVGVTWIATRANQDTV